MTFIASSPINIFIVGEQCSRIIKKANSICPFSLGKELNHASFFYICHEIVGADTFELLDILLCNLLSMKASLRKKYESKTLFLDFYLQILINIFLNKATFKK